MDPIKFQVEIPDAVYQKLGAFIEQKIDEAFTSRMQAINKAKIKLTRDEAAKRLRVSITTIDKLRTEGILKSQQIGKRIIFSEMEIENYLNRERG